MSLPAEPTTAFEYWTVIVNYCPAGLKSNPVWQELSKQISGVITSLTGTTAADTIKAIDAIAALPFPKGLGLVDSREYDTFCAGIIAGLNRVLVTQQGGTAHTPKNAPVAATLVRSGMMAYYSGGTSRASTAADEEYLKESEKEAVAHKALDTTEACKDAIAKHFTGTPYGSTKMWKRKTKKTIGGKIVREFVSTDATTTVTVTFNPEVGTPLHVATGSMPTVKPGTFSIPPSAELSGRVIFDLSHMDDDQLQFYCGPETTDGHLSDCDDAGCYDFLESLFSDYSIDVGAAENLHMISCKSGQSESALRTEVRNRLIAAGAVPGP